MRRTVFVMGFILSTVLFISACNDANEKEDKEEVRAIPVEVAAVEKGDFSIKKSVYGNTMPSRQTPVMLEEPGEISALKVENGDQVDKEDQLVTVKTPIGSKTIYAPTNGEVAQLNAQEESFQSNEDPLLMIVDMETIHASFQVTASIRNLFEKEDSATIFINDKKHEGTVLAVDSLPNDAGQYTITIKVANKDAEILPGTAAKLEVTDTKVKDTIMLPTDAIMSETDESFVYIVKDTHAEKVKVEITETQSEQSAVKGDLKKGDQVIVKGQFTLTDDAKIEVKAGNEE